MAREQQAGKLRRAARVVEAAEHRDSGETRSPETGDEDDSEAAVERGERSGGGAGARARAGLP